MESPDYAALRRALAEGTAAVEISELRADELDAIAWSGGRPHLESVAAQLERAATGEIEYLAVRVEGHPVAKGAIDFAKEAGAGTIWQLATHGELESLGLATRLVAELEGRALRRGINRLRLGVEHDNRRARRLYEHLGYRAIGESEDSWEYERSDGSRAIYTTTLVEMLKMAPAGEDDEWGDFPRGHADEVELFLDWLGYLRRAVIRKADGLTDDQARWRPDGALISLLGIVNHLTHVEWRWIDGSILGGEVERREEEFTPGPELTVAAAVAAYRERAEATDAVVRRLPLDTPAREGHGTDLRWVLLHLINETARHAGHADATRELLDGTTGA